MVGTFLKSQFPDASQEPALTAGLPKDCCVRTAIFTLFCTIRILLSLLFNIVLESLVRAVRQENEIRQIGKKKVNYTYLEVIRYYIFKKKSQETHTHTPTPTHCVNLSGFVATIFKSHKWLLSDLSIFTCLKKMKPQMQTFCVRVLSCRPLSS